MSAQGLRSYPPLASLRDVIVGKTAALSKALGHSAELTKSALDLVHLLSEPWGEWLPGDAPPWENDICDDGTPFELSAAFDGQSPAFRVLMESQAAPFNHVSSWNAGLALNQRIAHAGRGDLTMFAAVQSLFAPTASSTARFVLWHAAELSRSGSVLIKAYLNPQLAGADEGPGVLKEAFARLQMGDGWSFLESRIGQLQRASDIKYFSVDLASPEDGRAKVYMACDQSVDAIERLIAPAQSFPSGEAGALVRHLTDTHGPFNAQRPILCCFSFRRAHELPNVTVHVPIRCHVKHDAEALERILPLLTEADAETLRGALSVLAKRPLNIGRGMLSYASFRRQAGRLRVTVYLAPEVYVVPGLRLVKPQHGDI